jgi:hypothetical protein
MPGFSMLELDVIRWAESNGILANRDAKTQCLKSASKMGDICNATAKENKNEITNAVGHIAVDLILLCAIYDINFTTCLESAYSDISKRK